MGNGAEPLYSALYNRPDCKRQTQHRLKVCAMASHPGQNRRQAREEVLCSKEIAGLVHGPERSQP